MRGPETFENCATAWNEHSAYQAMRRRLHAQAIFPERALLDQPGAWVASLAEARKRAERGHIEEAIRQTGGEIAKAATLLGISRTTLWEKMRRLGL